MYVPDFFHEARPEFLAGLIQKHALATLVATDRQGELFANHIPLLLRILSPDNALVGHVAKTNPLWQSIDSGSSVLAVFQGPEHYISPSWYPSKAAHGRVVPTWNYAVVHVRGVLTWHHEADWIREQMRDLTRQHESGFEHPWKIEDAPDDFIPKLIASTVGLEIRITEMIGKWKMSQNRDATDRAGVVAGLSGIGTDAASQTQALVSGQSSP